MLNNCKLLIELCQFQLFDLGGRQLHATKSPVHNATIGWLCFGRLIATIKITQCLSVAMPQQSCCCCRVAATDRPTSTVKLLTEAPDCYFMLLLVTVVDCGQIFKTFLKHFPKDLPTSDDLEIPKKFSFPNFRWLSLRFKKTSCLIFLN